MVIFQISIYLMLYIFLSPGLIVVCVQASTLTQNDTGPVGPVTPNIYWSCEMFTGPTFFL